MSGTPALPNVGGPWVSHRQSFQIEVPCNISCNISRRIGVSAGQWRLLTARCHSLEKDKTAGQKPSDVMKERGLLPLPAAPPSGMLGSIQMPYERARRPLNGSVCG